MRIKQSASLACGAALSVAVWVKLDAVTADGRIVAKDYVWELESNSRQPQLTLSDGTLAASQAKLSVSEWHHVAFTFAAGRSRTYVDGIEGNFETNSINMNSGFIEQSSGMHVGSSANLDNFAKGTKLRPPHVARICPETP